MSIPSRPLLRSRWAWVAREHIQQRLKLSSNSRQFTSIPDHGATISFRRSHSSADLDNAVMPIRAFPIDVIDHQAAVRKFAAAIGEREFEKAREVLLDLVDRHTVESNMDIFRQLRAIVVHSAKPDVNILLELGLSLASKGYTDFVKGDISPAVEEYSTARTFSRFQAVLDKLEKTKPKPTATPLVFEEASEDYANVLSRFPLPPPSVMELIQEQLSPMLPDQTANDKSIFEEESDEYTLHAPSQKYPDNPSANTLLKLVKKQCFEQAYELLNEMQNINTPIPPSHMYEVAALEVLRNSSLPLAQKLEQFTKWFSLIPPVHESSPRRNFSELRYRVLQSPTSHLELIQRCALVLASKGYANNHMKQFLPAIFTFLRPTKLAKFISDLERRNVDYWLDHAPIKALQRARHASESIRGTAIRCLTYVGHIDQVMALVDDSEKNDLTFPIHTYDVLLKKLRTSPTRRYRNFIPLVESLRAQRVELENARSRDIQASLRSITFPNMLVTSLSQPADPTNLPAMLRYLRKAVFLEDKHRVLPSLLTDFIEDYLSTGRTFALELLLSKALRKNHRATKLFLFSEMRFYRQQQRFDLVIKTFVQHFHVVGVPRDEVQVWYNKLERREREGEGESLMRFSGFHPYTLLTNGKLWPDLEQCDFVWEALIIAVQEDEEALMELYKKFLHYAQHSDDPSADPALASVEPLPMATRFGLPVSGTTFHTFMYYMLPVFGPDFGHQILADMWSLDLWPGKYHYGTLARHHAESGHLTQVFAIINKLESGKVLEDRPQRPPPQPTQEAAGQEWQLEPAPSSEGDSKVPLFMQPDAPFYANIMQGLIFSMNVKATEEVHQRLQRRCPCPPGTYPPLDRALKKLADLKVLLGSRSPEQPITRPSITLYSQPPIMIDQEAIHRR